MPLRITRLAGPGSGSEPIRFGDDRPRIRIGRQPGCEVRYPADFDQVGRVHCTITLADDRYQLELSDNVVRVDGRPAHDEDVLPLRARVRLGEGSEAPVLLIETLLDESLPPTDPQGRGDPSLAARSLRTRRAIAVVVVALVSISGFFAFHLCERQSQEQQQTAAKFLAIQGKVETLGTELPEILARAEPSIYMVQLRDGAGGRELVGTAWVVAPGVLATNAHVAAIFEEIEEEGTPMEMVVRSGAEAVDHLVARVEMHPSFGEFLEVWVAYDPIRRSVMGALKQVKPIPGYDVALLYVLEQDTLAQPLPIAPEQRLLELEPGDVVAYFGYPAEGNIGINLEKPLGQSQVGRVTAVTDFFQLRRAGQSGALVHVSLPVHGGASGSPVLDTHGAVVAVLSAANVVRYSEDLRIATGVGVNYAQRADLVQELLDGRAEGLRQSRAAEWKVALERFASQRDLAASDKPAGEGPTREPETSREAIREGLVNEWLRWTGVAAAIPVLELAGETLPLDAAEPWRVEVETEAGVPYLAVAISDGDDIDLAIVRGDTLIGIDDDHDWYPMAALEADGGKYAILVAPGRTSDLPIEFSLFVYRGGSE